MGRSRLFGALSAVSAVAGLGGQGVGGRAAVVGAQGGEGRGPFCGCCGVGAERRERNRQARGTDSPPAPHRRAPPPSNPFAVHPNPTQTQPRPRPSAPSQVQVLVDNPESWPGVLGRSFPNSSNFFLNYVIMRAFLMNMVRWVAKRLTAAVTWARLPGVAEACAFAAAERGFGAAGHQAPLATPPTNPQPSDDLRPRPQTCPNHPPPRPQPPNPNPPTTG